MSSTPGRAPRLISYSSGYDRCGVNDYNFNLMKSMRALMPCETVRMPARRVGPDRLWSLLRLRREHLRLAAESDRYDVVLVQYHSSFWNGTRPVANTLPLFLRRIRKPVVMVLHEWPTAPARTTHEGVLPVRLAKTVVRRSLQLKELRGVDYADWIRESMFQRMAHIIVHTPEFPERLLQAGVPPDRISLERFPTHTMPEPCWSVEETIDRLRLRGRRTLVLFGMPVPRKGFDLAVKALASLPEDVALVLTCSEARGYERASVDSLREMARDLGLGDRFITTGYLDGPQLASLFGAADLALSPFTSVSGSSSIAHFISAGIPVVASDLPPIRHVTEGGAGIRLFTPGSVADLAENILAVIDSKPLQLEMRRKNRRYSAENDFDSLCGKVRGIVEGCVAGLSRCGDAPGGVLQPRGTVTTTWSGSESIGEA